MKRKQMMLVVAVVMVLLAGRPLKASAESISRSINDIGFSAYTNIDGASANAGTISSSSNLTVSVDADYTYINTTTLKTTTNNQSGTATMVKTVSFKAPEGCRSVKITATHTASSGNEKWTGTTSEIR